MKKINQISIATVLTASFVLGLVGIAIAATAVNLGTAGNFAVLAGSTITSTGSTVISGDLGLSPGTAVTVSPPATVSGTQQVANATAAGAQTDLVNAYNAAGQTPALTVPTELGGTTKNAGVYDSAAGTFGITGTLTLDAQGDSNAIFIFKAASTLITAGSSNVVLANGAQACNVFWQVGSSATLGTNSVFKGNILSMQSITLTTGANVEGRVLARNGAVTLDSNTVTRATCSVAPVVTPVIVPTPTPVVTPTPAPVFTPAPVVTPTITTTVPALPNTGIAPEENNSIPWNIIIPAGIFAVVFSLYLARKQQITQSK